MQCSNNLKQIGLSVHNLHDTYNLLPPAVSPVQFPYQPDDFTNPTPPWYFVKTKGPYYGKNYTVFSHLLPFIEQGNLYNKMDPLLEAGGAIPKRRSDVCVPRGRVVGRRQEPVDRL